MTENKQLAHVPVGETGVQFDSMDGMIRFAGAVCRAGLAPKGLDRPEQCFIALQMGMEIGLSPMQSLQNIAVINGKPSIYGDGALALAMGTGLVEDFQEKIEHEGDDRVAYCFVRRQGLESPVVSTFSVKDAKTAGLWGKTGPWKQYPNRMLQMRARSFALRNAFPDALHGLVLAEEAQDYNTSPRQAVATPVEPPKLELPKAEEKEVKTRGGVSLKSDTKEKKKEEKKKEVKPETVPAVDEDLKAWANADVTYNEKEDGPLDIDDVSEFFTEG